MKEGLTEERLQYFERVIQAGVVYVDMVRELIAEIRRQREPDLLSALRRCLPAIQMNANINDVEAAERAIAKAEGRA